MELQQGHSQDTQGYRQLDAQEHKLLRLRFELAQISRRQERSTRDKLAIMGKSRPRDFAHYQWLRAACCVVFASLVVRLLWLTAGPSFFLIPAGLAGAILGLRTPELVLDTAIKRRFAEISRVLPQMMGQVSVLAEGGLDTYSCLQYFASFSRSREGANPVTQVVERILDAVTAGGSMSEVLSEFGKSVGHPEFKHSLAALRDAHLLGGSARERLKDLAESLDTSRELQVEGVIATLELKALGPVALIMFSFIIVFMIQVGLQVSKGCGTPFNSGMVQ